MAKAGVACGRRGVRRQGKDRPQGKTEDEDILKDKEPSERGKTKRRRPREPGNASE